MPELAKNTYGQILKSSMLIGASSAFEIVLRIVRVKAIALMLGPAGVGLLGIYTSIADLGQTIAGLGVNSSGVREIAYAVGTGRPAEIGRTVSALRRVSFLLGALGGAMLAVFSKPIAVLTFESPESAGLVALLSLALLFRLIGAGQQAAIQGMRRIADLARIAAWNTVLGTTITIAMVYFLREAGLVPALVAAAALSCAVSWWYGRRIDVPPVPLPLSETRVAVAALLKLGLAFMMSGLLLMGSAYAIRVIVLREAGIEAAGFYQAAWTIGGLYLGFILGAMGTDFYPRLTAVASDDAECNRLVNEQTRIGVLIAGPGVLATLALAPLAINLLYTAQFAAAVEPLRWICLGAMLQALTWPLGYILVARGMRTAFIAVDLSHAIVHVGLAWLLVSRFGVAGAGIAFFGSYAFHVVVVYPLARTISGFRYAPENRRLLVLFLSAISAVVVAIQVLPDIWSAGVGLFAAAGTGVYAMRTLAHLVPLDRLPPVLRRALALLRLAPDSSSLSKATGLVVK